jgi:phage gp46-like protein
MVSRFQNIITSLPLTIKNIGEAEQAAESDLAWLIKEEIADKIEAAGRLEGKNRVHLDIVISKEGKTIYENGYGFLWEGGLNGV